MEKTIINSKEAPEPIGPYNQAIMVGNTLYVSGNIAIDAKTNTLIQSSIKEETQQIMKNIAYILKEAHLDYNNIVKTSIFITDMAFFNELNETYASYFDKDFPARETVQVSALPKGARVEISVIAVKHSTKN